MRALIIEPPGTIIETQEVRIERSTQALVSQAGCDGLRDVLPRSGGVLCGLEGAGDGRRDRALDSVHFVDDLGMTI